jgi:hypothetical protein
LQTAASNLFGILNPDLAHQATRQIPTVQRAEAAAAASFVQPGALHAQKMQDPAYQQQYQAAMAVFSEAAKKTRRSILPSATDSNQIQVLRADPSWRHERETPVKALLPHLPPPTTAGP